MADVGGARLRIETEPVKAAADEFRTIADELREELRQLVASVDDVVEGSWRGEAARMFGRDWDEFRAAATNIVDDADEIAIRDIDSGGQGLRLKEAHQRAQLMFDDQRVAVTAAGRGQ